MCLPCVRVAEAVLLKQHLKLGRVGRNVCNNIVMPRVRSIRAASLLFVPRIEFFFQLENWKGDNSGREVSSGSSSLAKQRSIRKPGTPLGRKPKIDSTQDSLFPLRPSQSAFLTFFFSTTFF